MWEDPIVAEVHRAREKLAADCNYDISAFFAGLRERQQIQKDQAESHGFSPSPEKEERETAGAPTG